MAASSKSITDGWGHVAHNKGSRNGGNIMGNGMEVVKNSARLPFELAGISWRIGRSATGYMVRSVVALPNRTNRHIAVDRRLHHPLDKALAAAEDIHKGRAGDTPGSAELVKLGEATVVVALVGAEQDLAVPDTITTAVAEVVAAEAIDPHAVALVPQGVADLATSILEARLPDRASGDDNHHES